MRTHLDIEHSGTVGDDHRTRMTFDENSIAHLMSVLTDLYSDPALAAIREYATNARDSHIAAGKADVPIEITLPTHLTPVYVVRDYGVGLDVNEIEQQFSKYGFSSKRDTDEQAGMLGLGCKSGLAYTSQFTLIARKHGVEATVLVTRDPDGAGVVQIIDTRASDEPTGVEVTIPVSNVGGFLWKAEQFFAFWEAGTVLVGGEPPDSFWTAEAALRLDDDVVVLEDGRLSHDYIVMGNVPYPVDEGDRCIEESRGSDAYAIIRVPIGTVNFTPSREALQYTRRTKETIDLAWTWIHDKIHQTVQAEIDQAATPTDAVRIHERWRFVRNKGQVGTYRYDCRALPFGLTIDRGRTHYWDDSSIYNSPKKPRSVDMADAVDCFHVVGYGGASLTASAKEKVRLYMDEHAISNKKVMLYPDPLEPFWLSGCEQTTWEVVKAIKLPSSSTAKTASKSVRIVRGAGDVCDLDIGHVMPSTPFAYVLAPEARKTYGIRNAIAVDIYVVATRSEKRFLKDNPTAIHASALVKAACDAFVAGLSPLGRVVAGMQDQYCDDGQEIRRLIQRARHVPEGVLDDELRAATEILRSVDERAIQQRYSHLSRAAGECNLSSAVVLPVGRATWPDFTDVLAVFNRYPALGHYQHGSVEYINAMYLYRTQLHLHPSTY